VTLATSIARAAINRATKQERPQAVFCHAEWYVIRTAEGSRFSLDLFRYPNYFVGVYDGQADLDDVVNDILAAA
jgi:hypothetical protein